MLSRSTHSLSRTCQFLEVSSSRGKRAFCRAIAGCYVQCSFGASREPSKTQCLKAMAAAVVFSNHFSSKFKRSINSCNYDMLRLTGLLQTSELFRTLQHSTTISTILVRLVDAETDSGQRCRWGLHGQRCSNSSARHKR